MRVSVVGGEYGVWTLTADDSLAAPAVAEVAVTGPRGRPDEATVWTQTEWVGEEVYDADAGTYTREARLFVQGASRPEVPPAGALVLGRARYATWTRLDDNPEDIVRQSEPLEIY